MPNGKKMRFRYFAVNLVDHIERRNNILSQCEKWAIPIEVFEAVTPQTLDRCDYQYDPDRTISQIGRGLSKSEIACGMSHISLWQRLLDDNNSDAYVIFEDDISIKSDIPKLLESIDFTEIDMLRLYGGRVGKSMTVQTLNDRLSIVKCAQGLTGTVAYVITKRATNKLIPYCNTFQAPIDTMYDRSYDHGVPIYAALPFPVAIAQSSTQTNIFSSTISANISEKKREVEPSVRQLITRLLYRTKWSLQKRYAEYKLFRN
ncbi:glycosyltransferase family 25 protein [Pseudovibrio sp. Tun.PSC04-5.I4]|uniref:glycosyltransferase family 25 protein n=1 Tax=Pseudovibrio sp. Tun.PSC04-5.I4 TaxID=1798213 RepID=UPI00088C24BD|nr:glycosyltransferase family 25 protein [Pseudovibrio sp. Tun.PSC04-5.I4]SDR23784.1 glycosyl transferase, family 25 [Pseudovibrio sp. Tun.PSC04-5.I4]